MAKSVEPIALETALAEVPGITPRTAEGLRELGIRNVGQLIAYLPFRHERHEAEGGIGEIVPGQIVSVRGTVEATRISGRGSPKARFEVALTDGSSRVDLVWFNQPYLHKRINAGVRLRVQGKAAERNGRFTIANAKWELIDSTVAEPEARDMRIRAVYPASEACSTSQIEKAVDRVLPVALPLIADHFDAAYRQLRELPELATAYRCFHAPENEEQIKEARRRLAYDELFLLQLGMAAKRLERSGDVRAPALKWAKVLDKRIRARFPFDLTDAQNEVIDEVVKDLIRDRPANRLVQGDVGSGKTVVALYAMLMAVASKHQAALMAPTEILAEQHFESISRMLAGSEVKVALLTGELKAAERKALLAAVAAGEIDMLVGTHAVISEVVKFKSLALAVVDEQHRFGVHQRAALRNKGPGAAPGSGGVISAGELVPHMLVMTATPIPRTLAMTLFGDLDVSTINALPPGRKPVKTRVVSPPAASEVYKWLRTRIEAGEQAFIVAPAIEPGETDDGTGFNGAGSLASVKELHERLSRSELAGVRIEMLHGQVPHEEREEIMERFRKGEVDVLIATVVIEVGIDIPNATVMVIEHAERFGLAQLHQLRGRVGRGSKPAACILIAAPITPESEARLAVIAGTNDGFKLAEKDLEIRGFGDVLGVRQSGIPPFRVADLSKDLELLSLARRDAFALAAASPKLKRPEDALLRKRLLKAHGKWLGLADVS